MGRNRYIIQSVIPTVQHDDSVDGYSFISPTTVSVKLFRLDAKNYTHYLGDMVVEVDGVFEENTPELTNLVEQKLIEYGRIKRTTDDNDPLYTVRKMRWDDISAIRDEIELSGFPFKETVFDSDEKSMLRIMLFSNAAMSAKSLGRELNVEWLDIYDEKVYLTTDDLIQMPLALAEYVNRTHMQARELRDKIFSPTATINDVLGIYWEGYESPPAE